MQDGDGEIVNSYQTRHGRAEESHHRITAIVHPKR